jgi:hypothetical protein
VARLAEKPLSQCEVLVEEVRGIASGGGVSHVRELVALAVLVLLEQNRRDRAIKHQVASVEQNLLYGLVSPQASAGWLLLLRLVGVRLIGYARIFVSKHRPIHIVVEALAFVRGGLVGLVIIGVVVRIGIDCVVTLAVRSVVVTGEVVDGMLSRRMLARLFAELLIGFSQLTAAFKAR